MSTFSSQLATSPLTVSLTPNGYADAVTKVKADRELFVLPHEEVGTNINKYLMKQCTVGTRNKEPVGKHIIVPYCESFPYCESSSFFKIIFWSMSTFRYYEFFLLLRSLLLRVPIAFKLEHSQCFIFFIIFQSMTMAELSQTLSASHNEALSSSPLPNIDGHKYSTPVAYAQRQNSRLLSSLKCYKLF